MTADTINVAVTGNRPFLEWDFNTSALVRNALPYEIERAGKATIRVWKYSRDTCDTYDDVRQVSQEIWAGEPSVFGQIPDRKPEGNRINIDFILHLGTEIRKEEFCFETRARRDGYEKPGDDGEFIDSKHLQSLGLPESLATSFDVATAWKSVKKQFPNTASRVSDDAGLYFCEFRLYSSLAEAWQHHPEKRGRVLFGHIPQRHDAQGIELARQITEAYIRALADDDSIQDSDS